MGGPGPHRVSHCRSPALCCIFILQSEKERAGGVVLVEGRVQLVCAMCVAVHMGWGVIQWCYFPLP